ncbi:hypothetical protein EIN_371980 [Entamoeba invadens IP1]|uniref:Uncharacterized protein n=1 Tax=Entamoeba invadens IP1 TaxID=370355 RepID=A0A0A1UC18_ENTIV|nr:hypothetical protein EIN_371980 [Entamoeba invadens IP1]ELP92776.1 hypothetical protein EIN_371980 [Entamoeba invadens IP1]|eukprot:XP_004259547.1 hypothetical protein EIN_371980 [Entamoeba invadens IP1]
MPSKKDPKKSVKTSRRKLKKMQRTESTQTKNKINNEKKPRKNFTVSQKVIPVSKRKNKPSAVTRALSTNGQLNGKVIYSKAQTARGREVSSYKTSVKAMKKMRQQGIPMKVIQKQLRDKREKDRKALKKKNKKLGVE